MAAVGGMLLKDMTNSALRTYVFSLLWPAGMCELVFPQKLKLSAEPQLKITQQDRLLFSLIGRLYGLMKNKTKKAKTATSAPQI